MERIRERNRYQKCLLLVMAVMLLVFAVIYAITVRREGYLFQNALLIPSQENGATVYSGKIQGRAASFTVSDDSSVVFRYGDKTYGPYTVREDPTAIPAEKASPYATGVEVYENQERLFRGWIEESGDSCWIYNEDGSLNGLDITYVTSDGIRRDADGNVVDPMEPSVAVIWELIHGPELSHKGAWPVYILALLVSAMNACWILFDDELFYLRILFTVRDAESAEPSDLAIASRNIGWAVICGLILFLLIMGLQ